MVNINLSMAFLFHKLAKVFLNCFSTTVIKVANKEERIILAIHPKNYVYSM